MGENFVVYDNNTSTLHELNEIAFFVLEQVKKGKSRGEILKSLIENYDVSEDKAEKDLESFLKLIKSKKLIVEKK